MNADQIKGQATNNTIFNALKGQFERKVARIWQMNAISVLKCKTIILTQIDPQCVISPVARKGLSDLSRVLWVPVTYFTVCVCVYVCVLCVVCVCVWEREIF